MTTIFILSFTVLRLLIDFCMLECQCCQTLRMNCVGFGFWSQAIALFCLCLCLSFVSEKEVLASVHTYPESSTQVMYRSQQSLRDLQDQAWQAVLFKRMEHGVVDSLHLRLVGFPGQVELTHPEALRITTGDGEF